MLAAFSASTQSLEFFPALDPSAAGSPVEVGAGLVYIGAAPAAAQHQALLCFRDRLAVYGFLITIDAQPGGPIGLSARLAWRAGDPFDRPQDVRDDPEYLPRLSAAELLPAGVFIVRNDGAAGVLSTAGELLTRSRLSAAPDYRIVASGNAAAVLSLQPDQPRAWFFAAPQSDLDDRRDFRIPAPPVLMAELLPDRLLIASQREFLVCPTGPRGRAASASFPAGLFAGGIAVAGSPACRPAPDQPANRGGALLTTGGPGAAALTARSLDNALSICWAAGRVSADGRITAPPRIHVVGDGYVAWSTPRELFVTRVSDGAFAADWLLPSGEELVEVWFSRTDDAPPGGAAEHQPAQPPHLLIVSRAADTLVLTALPLNMPAGDAATAPGAATTPPPSGPVQHLRSIPLPPWPPPITDKRYALPAAPLRPHGVLKLRDLVIIYDARQQAAYRIPE